MYLKLLLIIEWVEKQGPGYRLRDKIIMLVISQWVMSFHFPTIFGQINISNVIFDCNLYIKF